MGTLLHAEVQCPGRSSPPCWAERLDRARRAATRGQQRGRGALGEPGGADIPLITCCVYLWVLSWPWPPAFEPQGQSLAAVAVLAGEQGSALQAGGSTHSPADKGDIQFRGKIIFPL